MKRNWIAVVLAVFLCTAFSTTASAEEWTGEDYTFTVPEDIVYTFTPSTPAEDPSWTLAGIGDAATQLESYQDRSIVADFRTEDGVGFQVAEKSNSTTQQIYSLTDMTEEDREEFFSGLDSSDEEDISIEKGYLEIGGQTFFKLRIDSGSGKEAVHQIQYGTIVNGRALNFLTDVQGADFTPEQETLLDSAVNSLRFTEILERPVEDPINLALILGALLLLVAVIVAPLIAMPLKKRRDKRQKAEMVQQLSEFHKLYGGDTLPGEPRFINETDCTREAVHAFSLYHAYGKNLPSLAGNLLVCIAVLAVAFAFETTWWLKVLAVGVTVYCLYRIISMPRTIENIQSKVFGRGVSQTARYTFYEDGFRVSGIQSASVFPYFQIVSLHRRGHYMYLYYGPDNAYLVDQFGFTQGEFNDFVKFIEGKTKRK